MPCATHRRLWGYALLWLAAAAPVSAQEPVVGPAAPANRVAATDDDAPPLREQTIYVPYDKLRETFEKTGRGVFIPYARFEQLWKAAREQQRKPPDGSPPAAAVITEADSEATVGKEVVRVVARLKIDVLARGWVEVPLRLADAGVISATLIGSDGQEQPARLAVSPDGGYKLVIENKSKEPIQLALRLEYAKAFNKTPGRNDVSFAAPQAPVNRWRVRIPESGVKIHIDPLIAATEMPSAAEDADGKPDNEKAPGGNAGDDNPGAEKANGKKPAEETVLLAFVGAAPAVRIDWTAKAEGASGLAALANVAVEQAVRVEEAVLRTHATLAYSISRAELGQLTLDVPADQKVVNVASPNVRQWSVEAAGETQKIVVELFEPARLLETIEVDLEQYREQAEAGEAPAGANAEDAKLPSASVPIVRALDVSRQQGIIVVDVAEGLQIEARTRDGLLQLDAADLPKALATGPHELSFRYAVLPFRLTLDVTKIKPRLLADEFVVAYLEPEHLTLQLQAIFTVERAGVFTLDLDVPAGFEIREVRGDALAGAAGAGRFASSGRRREDASDRQPVPQGAGSRGALRRPAKAARRRQSARPHRQDFRRAATHPPRRAGND